jgi:hypothetical protein
MELLRGLTLTPASAAAQQLKQAALEELDAEVGRPPLTGV